MEWWMMFMMGLASPAMPAAALLSPDQDGLTLEPSAIVQVEPQQTEVAPATDADDPATAEAISLMQKPALPDVKPKGPKKPSDDRSGFIYEPVYSSTSDRVQYQMGSGLGVGLTTDASLAISQSVRLKKGLDLSVYYAHPVEINPRDPRSTGLEPSDEFHSLPAAPSAGIRLEWKF